MKVFLLLLLAFEVMAQSYDAQIVVEKVLKKNLTVQAYSHQEKELSFLKDQLLGKYDYFFEATGSQYRDKSLQDSIATPSNIDMKSFSFNLSKQWSFGVRSSIFLSNDQHDYTGINFGTFTPKQYRSNKNYLGASLLIDLTQNVGGNIDQAILENLEDEKEIITMSKEERIDRYLFLGLQAFYQTILSKQRFHLYAEMKKNAQGLLNKAKDRRKRGVIDNRELFIYQANLTSMNQLLIQSTNSLEQAKSNFSNFIDIDFESSDFQSEEVVKEKERLYLERFVGIDFEAEAKKSRSLKILEKEVVVGHRGLKNSSKELLPDLNLSISATGAGKESSIRESLNQSTQFEHPQYAIGVNLSYPLGNIAAKNKYAAMKYKVLRQELEYKDSLQKRVQQLKVSAAELKRLMTLSVVARDHLENEKAKYRNELKEYGRGRSSARDVVQFQNDYFSSRLNRIQSVINYKLALNQYLLVTGKLAQHYGVKYREVEL